MYLKIFPFLHFLGKNQHNWCFCSHIVSSKANDKLVQSLSEIENAKTSTKDRKIASLKIDPIKLRISLEQSFCPHGTAMAIDELRWDLSTGCS